MANQSDIFKIASGLRCKVGDLAIIVGGSNFDNLGCIVEILEQCDPIAKKEGYDWWAKSTGRLLKCFKFDNDEVSYCQRTNVDDAHLLPISGMPLEDLVEDDDEVTA